MFLKKKAFLLTLSLYIRLFLEGQQSKNRLFRRRDIHLLRCTLLHCFSSPSAAQWCQFRAGQHRATDGGEYAHERRATYVW